MERKVAVFYNRSQIYLLTSADNTVSFEPGYYEGITVSADINTGAAQITYTHHIHDLTQRDLTLENDTPSSGASYGPETSSAQGGCYAQYVAGGICGNRVWCSGTTHIKEPSEDFVCSGYCSRCGCNRTYHRYGGVDYAHYETCTYTLPGYYKANCGYVSGEVIQALVQY